MDWRGIFKMNEKEGEEAVEDQNCAEGYKIYQK